MQVPWPTVGPRTADNHDNVRPTNGPDIQTIKYAYTSARARAVTVNVSQDSMRTKEEMWSPLALARFTRDSFRDLACDSKKRDTHVNWLLATQI